MTETVVRNAYPSPIEFQKIERDWAAEAFSFGVFRDPPGQEWNNFVHESDEYVLVAEGQIAIGVGSEHFVADPGDLVRVPKGVTHSLKTLSAEGSVWLYGYGLWEHHNE